MTAASETKGPPAWRRAQALAHTVYALVDESGLRESEAGQRLRRASVSVPSLLAEAFLELDGAEQQAAVVEAAQKLDELSDLLPELSSASSVDLRWMEEELAELGRELRTLRQPVGAG